MNNGLLIKMRKTIELALLEDMDHGDPSSWGIFDQTQRATVDLTAKDDGILCGIQVFAETFYLLDPETEIQLFFHDGDAIQRGDLIGKITGTSVGKDLSTPGKTGTPLDDSCHLDVFCVAPLENFVHIVPQFGKIHRDSGVVIMSQGLFTHFLFSSTYLMIFLEVFFTKSSFLTMIFLIFLKKG